MAITPTVARGNEANAASDEKGLSVCTDVDGRQKTGPIDVLLLLDNSKSLNTASGSATDPENRRFDAIRDLLVSLDQVSKGNEEQKGVDINFGLVSFGSVANEQIPLAPLSDPEKLSSTIRQKMPNDRQEQVTNYVSALEKAAELLAVRPAENCRLLVWFTDGQFESSEISRDDPARQKRIEDQANYLKSRICGQEGFADKFHDLRINTFVLVLRPTRTDARLATSYGAMQAITGALRVPETVEKESTGDLCGNLSSRAHLGDILIAEDASTIARKIPTMANAVGGWTPATVCPITLQNQVPEMPAARHLAKISFTAYEKGAELESLKDSKIVDVSGREHPFSEYLRAESLSAFEAKFTFTSKAQKSLDQGWKFDIEDGENGWCVQILHQRFTIRFTSDTLKPVAEERPGNLLTDGDKASLIYAKDDEEKTPIASVEVARAETDRIVAFLNIDPTGEIFDEAIPVAVKQLSMPSIGCESLSLVVNPAELMPKSRRLSNGCEIDTKYTTLGEVAVALRVADSFKSSNCNAELGIVETAVGEDPAPDSRPVLGLTHAQGTKSLHLVLSANERSARCATQSDAAIELTYEVNGQRQTTVIPVTVDVSWLRVPPSSIVAVITILLVLLAGLVNLLIMRLIARRTSKMPASGVYAYEVPVRLVLSAGGRVQMMARDGSDLGAHQFELSNQIALRVNKSRTEAILNGGSRSRLRVKQPPLHRPFRSAALVLDSPAAAFYWKSLDEAAGLSPLSTSGVIVHSPRQVENSVEALVTLLVPALGTNRNELVRSLLTARATSVVQAAATEEGWFGDDMTRRFSSPNDGLRSGEQQGEPAQVVPPQADDDGPPRPSRPLR
jgi:hypothetical protein